MITLTEKAGEKLKEIMTAEDRGEQGLRVGITRGGCSGFSYALGLDDQRDEDLVVEQHGIRVLVDPMSARFLRGAEIDYVESLMGGGFAIRNPNAVRSCGCGQSFRTADETGNPEECM